MCGISGLINYKGNVRAVIAGMNEHMKDRGPDADGIWISPDSKIALGHRRLAIRDLSSNGAQPMRSHSGRYMMVYNGEIYNASLLKDRLIKESFAKIQISEVLQIRRSFWKVSKLTAYMKHCQYAKECLL